MDKDVWDVLRARGDVDPQGFRNLDSDPTKDMDGLPVYWHLSCSWHRIPNNPKQQFPEMDKELP